MDETSVREYITQTFDGVAAVDATGGSFFFNGPERKFPFAAPTTSDEYDQASNLSRPSVFRLNVGVSKETLRSLFGAGTAQPDPGGAADDFDFTALDRIMPPPVYGKMHWICVLNPGEQTFAAVRELLVEAYNTAVRKHARRDGGADDSPRAPASSANRRAFRSRGTYARGAGQGGAGPYSAM